MPPSPPIALVTGGAGFIGSHMVDLLLARGYHVRVLDSGVTGRAANLAQHDGNPALTYESGDLLTLPPGAPVFRDVRYVFHFAGLGHIMPSIENPARYMRANVQGTVALLEAARAAGVRKVVYAASSSCYGSTPPFPTPETAPIDTEHPYALSKYLGELAALHWHRVYRLPVNVCRIFTAYGPRAYTGSVSTTVFAIFLAQRRAGQPLTIVGDGTQARDYVHVTDVARAFLAAAETERVGQVWNVGTGTPHTINQLAELIGGPRVHVPTRPGEPPLTHADPTKSYHDLGWEPRVPFEQGVRELVADLDAWRDAPVWTPTTIGDATRQWFEVLAR